MAVPYYDHQSDRYALSVGRFLQETQHITVTVKRKRTKKRRINTQSFQEQAWRNMTKRQSRY